MKRRVRAYAIVGSAGNLHLDKVMASKDEAWGLLADEMHNTHYPCRYDTAALKRLGYRCKPITITYQG